MSGTAAIRRPLTAPRSPGAGTPPRARGRFARRPGGTVAALLALYACWGSSIPAMKLMVASVPPVAGAGVVFALGGLVLGALAVVRSRRDAAGAARPSRDQVRSAALAGIVLLVGGQGLATVVLTELTASLTAVLAAAIPLWVVVLTAASGRHVGRSSVLRLAAGFGGIVLVVATAPSAAFGGAPLAVGAACVAPVLWAWGSLLTSRTEAMPADRVAAAAVQLLAGGGALLVVGASLGQLAPSAWEGVTGSSLGAAAFLLLADSLAGFLLYTRLLATAPPHLVSTYAYATPLVAVALGATVLGEPLWAGALLGGVLVVAAVALEVRAPATSRRSP